MGGTDDFDNEPAPLPPHERAWRHPAEVSDDKRRRHMFESAPPPLGRRIAALVGLVSVAASGVILFVAVPKGLEDRPETEAAAVTTTSSVPPKGGARFTAVPIRHDLVVTSGTPGDSVVLPDGTAVRVTEVVARVGRRISVLRTDTPVSAEFNDINDEEFRYLAMEGRLSMTMPDGSRRDAGLGIETVDKDKWWPFDVDSTFESVALVKDLDGQLVGIAICDHNETWAMNVSDLVRTVTNDG